MRVESWVGGCSRKESGLSSLLPRCQDTMGQCKFMKNVGDHRWVGLTRVEIGLTIPRSTTRTEAHAARGESAYALRPANTVGTLAYNRVRAVIELTNCHDDHDSTDDHGEMG